MPIYTLHALQDTLSSKLNSNPAPLIGHWFIILPADWLLVCVSRLWLVGCCHVTGESGRRVWKLCANWYEVEKVYLEFQLVTHIHRVYCLLSLPHRVCWPACLLFTPNQRLNYNISLNLLLFARNSEYSGMLSGMTVTMTTWQCSVVYLGKLGVFEPLP